MPVRVARAFSSIQVMVSRTDSSSHSITIRQTSSSPSPNRPLLRSSGARRTKSYAATACCFEPVLALVYRASSSASLGERPKSARKAMAPTLVRNCRRSSAVASRPVRHSKASISSWIFAARGPALWSYR